MKNTYRLSRIALVLALLLASVPFTNKVFAASTGTVAATVTPQSISVSVSSGTVAYGTLDISSTKDTTASGLNDTQTASNDGNVTEDFNVKSSDASGGTTWTLAATPGTNQYEHEFSTNSGGSWAPMSTSYSSLATSVTSAGTKNFDLKLFTPTSVSDFVQKTITVTVQAVIH